jgi:acetyl-CoA carboxylase beta subunit
MRFSQLDLDQQLKLLFDELFDIECDSLGGLRVAQGVQGTFNIVIVGFDFSVHGGSIGVSESKQLRAGIESAKQLELPLVMLLNTGGVRVTEGADGLAAFRFVFKDLLDAKLDGLRVLSLVTHHCFGGGSMLASISDMVLVNSSFTDFHVWSKINPSIESRR